jgi:hypothetical protein
VTFELRAVVVAPGEARRYDAAEWRDAIVTVEAGAIELEGVSGSRCGFRRGDLLALDGVPLRALRNRGTQPAVLVSIARSRLSA